MFFNKKLDPKEFFPSTFIDIHSHLLPGIDDGSKDMDNSIELVEKLIDLGYTQFRITPHVLGGVWENSSDTIKEKKALLRAELDKRGYQNIKIHAAAEYMMDDNFSKLLAQKDILPLKDDYILVEMSFFNAPFNLDEILFEIQLKGYIPVLAHPERYAYYHDRPAKYQKLLDAGCLFQLNLLSLTDNYGKEVKKTAYDMLKKGMYKFVGTDTHNTHHLELIASIANKKNKTLLDPLFKNNIDVFSF